MPDESVPLYKSRYPDFDVLSRAHEWDALTRRLVRDRVENTPPIRFFTRAEARTLEALADTVIPQDDRPESERVPIIPQLDNRLHAGEGRGYRYEALPPDPEFWRRVAAAFDAEAAIAHGRAFDALPEGERTETFRAFAEGRTRAREWQDLPVAFALPEVIFEFTGHYYAHPWAWSEIGFPGPKFPGVYARTDRVNPGEAVPGAGAHGGRLGDTRLARWVKKPRDTVPKRVLGVKQLDMQDVFDANEARVDHRDDGDVPDACIVGAGAAGSVLAAKLAEAGLSVVVLEAGRFWVPERDWVSDETGAAMLYWTDPRVSGGRDAPEMGANNSGKGVGGSTAHYAMVKLRFHGKDFRARTLGGVADDWPINYDDLKAYYDEVEDALGIAGPSHFPWGEFRGPYPQKPHPASSQSRVLLDGCAKLGLAAVPTPIATLSAPKDGRPPCTYRGLCLFGCKPNAKSSTLVTYVPRAVKAGAVIKHGCMVTRVNTGNGRVKSVTYVRKGKRHEQRARTFIVSGYAVETPRLLLASANAEFPDGVANGSGLVGKRFMTHASHRAYARFDHLPRQYKGPPTLGVSQAFYDPPEDADFPRGYTIETGGVLPVGFSKWLARDHRWGWDLRRTMLDYNHYAGIALNGECLPYESNEVRLHATEKDRNGMPVAHVRFSWGDAERRMIRHGQRTLQRILEAAGGRNVFHVHDTAHLMGTCRMGEDADASVVDPFCRSHDVPNLFICDGSVFVTSAAVNPSLTIEALAARTADYLARVRE